MVVPPIPPIAPPCSATLHCLDSLLHFAFASHFASLSLFSRFNTKFGLLDILRTHLPLCLLTPLLETSFQCHSPFVCLGLDLLHVVISLACLSVSCISFPLRRLCTSLLSRRPLHLILLSHLPPLCALHLHLLDFHPLLSRLLRSFVSPMLEDLCVGAKLEGRKLPFLPLGFPFLTFSPLLPMSFPSPHEFPFSLSGFPSSSRFPFLPSSFPSPSQGEEGTRQGITVSLTLGR